MTVAPADDALLSKAAAKYLRVSHRTLERWRVEGTGPRYRKLGYRKLGPHKRSRVLYLRCDLDEFLNRFTYSSTSEYKPYPPRAE